MRLRVTLVAIAAVAAGVAQARAVRSGDPYCTGSYGNVAVHPGRLRLGIDPGIAGSVGPAQLPAVPDDPARDLSALKALRPPARTLVVRLNRLFWSDGAAGIARFQAAARRYSRAGFKVELQVRYHPAAGEAGNLAAWRKYVRRVVDVFGSTVVAMTITNEVNVTFSPNTSDGYYAHAQDALIGGIEAAHAEAAKRGYRRLRLGFTYAYRFAPSGDSAFFAYLGSHGGAAFRRALGFVGVDLYPGSVYPPVMAPGDSYRAELTQALGVVRACLAPKAGIGAKTPIWITENGVPTGVLTDAQQAAALEQLVSAAHDYAGTFGLTDYRWFNLRDSNSSSPVGLVGPSFATDGLLRSDYSHKPAFAAYWRLIARFSRR